MRRLAGLSWGLGAAAVAALVALLGLLEPLDHLLFDLRVRQRAAPDAAARTRVVVATDDDLGSYEALAAWPWDRSVWAQLHRCLRDGGASVVGLDVLFDALGRSPEGDQSLAETLGAAGRGVLGAGFEMHGTRGTKPTAAERMERHTLPAPPGAPAPMAARALLPLAALGEQAAALGFLNTPADADGKTRRLWLLLEYQGRLFPSLPLAVYLAHLGKTMADVRLDADGGLHLPTATGATLEVPLDADGCMLLEPALQDSFPVRSVSGIFSLYEGGEPATTLADYAQSPVLVGTVMTGSGDIVATAREAQVYGVFVHASALAQLLDGRFLRTGGRTLELGLVLALALAGALLGARLRGPLQALAPLALLGVPLGASLLLATGSGLVPPLSAPLLGGLLGWGAAATVRARAEQQRRRQIETAFQGLLPKPVLEQLLADPAHAWARPQRCEGALLLARITRHDGSRLAPEEDATLVSELFGAAVETVARHGGTVVRLDVDRIAAVFGAPVALPQPGPAALHAAFDLREGLKRINAIWVDRMGAPFEAAFALHAGVLTVGSVGAAQHREYAVFGPEAQAAAALLEKAGPDQCLASDRFQPLVATLADAVVVDQSTDGRSIYELSAAPGA